MAAGLGFLYYRQSLAAPFNSDGAGSVLQGQAMIGGNPLLRGWWVSDVSFYTTELPQYAVVTAVRGLAPDVVHLCGALTYTLIVGLTALVARGRERGKPALARMALAAAMVLAPSVLGGTEVFLQNPDHVGTAVPVLLALFLLGRPEAGRPGASRRAWLVPAGLVLVLTLAQAGDGLTLVAVIAPAAAVCAARLVRRRSWRDDGLPLAAAVASAGLAKLIQLLLRGLGGFDQHPLAGVALAPLGQLKAAAGLLGPTIVLLFGANGPGPPRQPQTVRARTVLLLIADLHVIGLVLAGAGLVAGLALVLGRADAGRDRVTQVLVAALAAVLAAGLCTTVLRSSSNAHEIAVLLPLAAALAGRVLPGLMPARGRRFLTAALGGWLALTLAALCYAAAWPPAPLAQQPAAAWLAGHHQRAGLAGYWQATVTTVTSGGQVVVAPVKVDGDQVTADHWESSAAWYGPGQRATFVIAAAGQPGQPAPAGALTVAAATARFGRPVEEHAAGADVILVYGYNLLTRLDAR